LIPLILGPDLIREEIMCTNNVGVARRIDVEHISKEIADLIKSLDKEVKGEEVQLPVDKVKKIARDIEKLVK
jgi:hypothetical protein